jgi:hypothetical protein
MQRTMVPPGEERPARYINVSFGDGAMRGADASPFQPVADRRAVDRGSSDQRASPRRRVLLSALVVKSDFSGMYRCGVHDVSDNGARLKIPSGILLPSDFWLIATSAGLAYEAKTVWRGYPNVGVSVGEPMDLQDPTTRAGRKLRALWMSVTT